jgi:uncharacterized protein YqgC (DUF456 family)
MGLSGLYLSRLLNWLLGFSLRRLSSLVLMLFVCFVVVPLIVSDFFSNFWLSMVNWDLSDDPLDLFHFFMFISLFFVGLFILLYSSLVDHLLATTLATLASSLSLTLRARLALGTLLTLLFSDIIGHFSRAFSLLFDLWRLHMVSVLGF